MMCSDLIPGFLLLFCLHYCIANAPASTAYTCSSTPSAESVPPSKPAFYTTSNTLCAIGCKANLTCTTYTLIGNQCYFKAINGGPHCKLKTSASPEGEARLNGLTCGSGGFNNVTVGFLPPCSRLTCTNCGNEVCPFKKLDTNTEWVPILTPFDCWVRCTLTPNCISFSVNWPWCSLSSTHCSIFNPLVMGSIYCQCVA